MKHTKRAQRGSVLLLIIAMMVLLGWSVSQPMPQQPSALPPGTALAKLTEPAQSPYYDSGDGSDFIDPQRFPARPPAQRPVPSSEFQVPSSKTENPARGTAPAVLPGHAVRLDPKGSLNVPLSGRIEFVVTLTNLERDDWQVIGELYVTKGDGRTEKLFGPRAIRLGPAQTLRLPVGFAVNPKRFPPGPTQFLAVLKDQTGKTIDHAIITFTIKPGQ